ncbi:MAG: hypothetical protein INH41_31480 [Myxococcaceae bacterium]|nr:hypothetical protein [Myxococcaceae bacterium]MCA3016930.1 hypothetical protein [Myxococcaceae bacterium]
MPSRISHINAKRAGGRSATFSSARPSSTVAVANKTSELHLMPRSALAPASLPRASRLRDTHASAARTSSSRARHTTRLAYSGRLRGWARRR